MSINHKETVIIVGGGAAGFFAAINTKQKSPKLRVILLEGTRRVLTKVKISGGGRCNLTHNCFDPAALASCYPRGSKELKAAFYSFQPKDTLDWFEKRGVKAKAEKDGRMFPVSNKSTQVIDCLLHEANKSGIELLLGKKIIAIQKDSDKFILSLFGDEILKADHLVLATGSSPSGYNFSKELGHEIISPVPSLFTFNIKDPLLEELMGQSFNSVHLELSFEKNLKLKKYKQTGPLLITHWGLSGPAVLKLSAFAARDLQSTNYQAKLKVNFLPLMNKEEALDFLLSYKENHKKDLLKKKSPFELTKRFWARILEISELSENLTWYEVSKKNLQKMAQVLTENLLSVKGKGVFKEEFVTAGGIPLKEVDFKTMESRACSSLYFCGEILNVDGITGGFNFQNAWTTAWLVSESLKD